MNGFFQIPILESVSVYKKYSVQYNKNVSEGI